MNNGGRYSSALSTHCLIKIVANYWLAQEAFFWGDFFQGQKYLQNAGDRGKELLHKLQKEQAILAQSLNHDFQARIQAVKDWEQNVSQPGHCIPQPDPTVITDCHGGEIIYTRELDLYMTGYIAAQVKPVSMEVLGPVAIQLEMRHLYTHPPSTSVDQWVKLYYDEEVHYLPVLYDNINPGLELINNPKWSAGRKFTLDLQFGPGLHKIKIYAQDTAIWTRALILRPEIPSAVLPPLTSQTLAAFLQGTLLKINKYKAHTPIQMITRSGLSLEIPLTQQRIPDCSIIERYQPETLTASLQSKEDKILKNMRSLLRLAQERPEQLNLWQTKGASLIPLNIATSLDCISFI